MRTIQFLSPRFTRDDIQAVTRTLRSGWLVLGRETDLFEQEFAHYLGTSEAVMTNGATTALHLCLLLAGVRRCDEVITSPLSYVSTATAIIHAGARPVFVDIDPRTGLLNLDLLEASVTERTRAVIPVHLWGQMVNMRRLRQICDPHGIAIVEDAAHAVEGERDGVKPGQLSFAACFSFHVSKTVTAGEGGCIATNDKRAAEQARLLRRDGIHNVGFTRRMEVLGYKYLSTDFQAALLRSQLKRIDSICALREKVYDMYERFLRASGVQIPEVARDVKHARLFCVVLVRNRFEIMSHLKTHGIQTAIHYEPIHLEPYFMKTYGYKPGDFPAAEDLGGRVLSLPLHSGIRERDVRYIVARLAEMLNLTGAHQVRAADPPERRRAAEP